MVTVFICRFCEESFVSYPEAVRHTRMGGLHRTKRVSVEDSEAASIAEHEVKEISKRNKRQIRLRSLFFGRKLSDEDVYDRSQHPTRDFEE